LHGTAFAVLTLANNAFGLAPGPIVTGWMADRIGLLGALQLLPKSDFKDTFQGQEDGGRHVVHGALEVGDSKLRHGDIPLRPGPRGAGAQAI